MRRILPWLVLLIGALIHAYQVTGTTWDKVRSANHARDFASYYYAVQAADAGEDPYDTRELSRLAREDRTRKKVYPYFYPPPFLLGMTWALPLDLGEAYQAWYWADSFFLLLVSIGIWRWLPGPWTLVALGVILASFTPIQDNHWMGQANLPVLALVVWGLALDASVSARASSRAVQSLAGGVLLGLACMAKMSPGLLVAWWLLRKRWLAAFGACATAVVVSVVAVPLVDVDTQIRFYREVLPSFGNGDYNGLRLSLLLPGNHSIPNLWAQMEGTGKPLTGAAHLGASLTNLALVAVVFNLLRKGTRDSLGIACGASAVMVCTLLVPVFSYEHHLSQLIFPLVVSVAAIAHRRVIWPWLPLLLILYVPLAWYWGPLKALASEVGGGLGWFIREAKFFGLLGILALTVRGARGPRGESSEGRAA